MDQPLNKIMNKPFQGPLDVISHLQTEHTQKDNYGYRGQQNSDWKLETTFSRFVDQCIRTHPNGQRSRDEITKALLFHLTKHFRENTIINKDVSASELANIDLWQLGQHHGLPSPLLDWSESPYVGLFFALHETPEDGSAPERCLWVLDKELLSYVNERVENEVWPSWSGRLQPETLLHQQFPLVTIEREITSANQRMAYQRGFFTKHAYYQSFETWLNRVIPEIHHGKSPSCVLHKLSFSCSHAQRLHALAALDKMNINYRTLFPDSYGSANAAKLSAIQALQQPKTISLSFST